ncbi:MAG: hypothetical protein JG774_1632 [Desulfomicrobiaceae bacterium]|jgi:hypothetical protein|nr:DUF1992 domain-containing protein [Desulfomicrobiaceae bacterium]MBZ4648669.1 hypothetical protein [Desulfomicrobiaceae bacterium]MBZ4685887.1 hypothetical protein [Desulfomicrobiaceae bacterium]MDK2872882.1 hypothetical protein [Desulfomicrobiaceae bacterium]HCF06103.1 DUF1992 domain-containing protein [Desulfomicrobiaceae bacterium]
MNLWTELAEKAILEAQARGEFDNLPGAGKPLNLEDDTCVPPELRMAYTVLKNAGFVPPEVAEQREIRSLIECLERESDPARALRQMRLLEVRILKAKLRNPLLTEENSRYFDKIVARMTLAGDPT